MKSILRAFVGLLLLGLGLAYLGKRDYQRVLEAPLLVKEDLLLDVPKGSNFDVLVLDMDQKGLLPAPRARLYLRLYARLNPQAVVLKAGEYQLTPGINAVGLLDLLASGKVVLHELRLVEGWRFSQALQVIRAHAALDHQLPAAATDRQIMETIGHAEEHPEGRFFPDTYRFPRGTSDVAFLRRAYTAAEKLLQDEWARREPNLPYEQPYQALIMASIVERETGIPDERGQIAGVFVRRLQRGMRLQTDPTVIYGLGEVFDGNLRKKDLLADTPYNTYLRAGLPPTPICLPGRAALQAALHPAPGDAIYFVSRGDGSHEFSASLREHGVAVRRYQLGGKP